MNQELVSVIMPTYNAGKFLSDSIASVLNQTHTNLELLITDDCSTDASTREILQRYSQADSRVKVEYLDENKGPGYARNQSIKRAVGRYIAFCDGDDRWLPDKLERQIAYMYRKSCALCSTSYIICDENGEETGVSISPERITYGMLKRDNKIGCSTAIYDTQLLGRKFYMPTLRKRQDWAMLLTILRECKVCHAITEPLTLYRNRQGSLSSQKFSLIKYNVRVYHDILGFGILKSYLYFYFLFMPSYLLKVWKRKCDSRRFLKSKMSGKN